MTARIQQLIKLDEMLNYAIECKWDRCYEIAKENPSYVNEKPPYRRFYLIHHMACASATEQFERFKKIKDCKFDLTLRADRKKINTIAKEQKQLQFAAYIEKQCPFLLETDDPTLVDTYTASDKAVEHTKNITNTLMEQKNIVKNLDQNLMGEPTKYKTRDEVMQHIADMRTQHEEEQKQKSNATVKVDEQKQQDAILDTLTCPLTLAVFVEPGKYDYYFVKENIISYSVVAADGFTYENSAILKWFEKNDRSPMTNQQLSNKDLKPNNIVKQIIHTLQLLS